MRPTSVALAAAVSLLLTYTTAGAAPVAAGVVLSSEMAVNGHLDFGEGVGMTFCIHNPDAAPSPVLRGTLQVGGGVAAPSEAQLFGSLDSHRSECRTYTFQVAGSCGVPLVATLVVDTGSGPGTPLTYVLPTGPALANETFDNVTAPTVPVFWTMAQSGGSTGWAVVAGGSHSGPNRAIAPEPVGISNATMTGATLAVPAGESVLTFRHAFDTESGFDGGVLEISIAGGAYQDIVTAGGLFLGGSYSAVISGIKGSAIAGRLAFTGASGGYIESRVRLPAAAAGQSVRLRWRFVTDTTVGGGGWSVDSVVVASAACAGVPQNVPWGHHADIRGNDVTLRWNPPLSGPADEYVVEASTDLGATFPFVFPAGAATGLPATAPSGRYVTRVRAVQGGVAGPPSTVLNVPVGTSLEPAQPRNLLASPTGAASAALVWSLDERGGTPTAVMLNAGSAPGLSDIASVPLPPWTTALTVGDVPAGTYYVWLQQLGLNVPGDPSDITKLAIPGGCPVPAPPPFLTPRRQPGAFVFTWELGPLGTAAPTSWVLEAGNAPGLANLASIPLPGRQFVAPVPAPGTYYVRAVAVNDCGASAASNELTLVVP